MINRKNITIILILLVIVIADYFILNFSPFSGITRLAGETTTIKAFFNNDKLDPEFSCNKVFPVERIILKDQNSPEKSLELLFDGPTVAEKEKGFLTSLPQGVKIQSLVIENGIAKVDFNEALEFQVGGSCRVAAIRWQIIETLKQFPAIKEVVISIGGRTEDILQP